MPASQPRAESAPSRSEPSLRLVTSARDLGTGRQGRMVGTGAGQRGPWISGDRGRWGGSAGLTGQRDSLVSGDWGRWGGSAGLTGQRGLGEDLGSAGTVGAGGGSLGLTGQWGLGALGWVSGDHGSAGTVRVSGDHGCWGGSLGLGQGSLSLPPDAGRQRSESQVCLD